MEEEIIAYLEKLTFSVDNRHKREEIVSKEFYTEFGLVNIDIQYSFSKDLETTLSVDVYNFEITDCSGVSVDCDITDAQILNAINY